MVMVHFGPNPVPDSIPGQVYDVSHGRASILFALLAGIGVTLLYRSASQARATDGYAQILSRAALLLPLGLWLQSLDHGVLVILQYYAVYFLFAALIVGIPTKLVLVIGLAFIAVGPLAYIYAEQQYPLWFEGSAAELGDPAGVVLRQLLISGSYPLVTWGAPVAIGMWVGRQNLSSNATRGFLSVAGVALIVSTTFVGSVLEPKGGNQFANLFSAEPHSQGYLWMIDAVGSALLILSLSLILSDIAGRTAWPLVAGGQLALTIYVGHLLLLHRYTGLLRRDELSDAYLTVGLFVLAAVLASTLWLLVFKRGPLESVFRAPGLLWQELQQRIR